MAEDEEVYLPGNAASTDIRHPGRDDGLKVLRVFPYAKPDAAPPAAC